MEDVLIKGWIEREIGKGPVSRVDLHQLNTPKLGRHGIDQIGVSALVCEP